MDNAVTRARQIDEALTRRNMLLKLGVAAGLTAFPGLVAGQTRPPAVKAPPTKATTGAARFFSAPELALLDEVAEMIIPADEHSGGARAAGVALLIDRRIGETLDPAEKKSWRDDLAEINRLTQVAYGRGFLAAAPAQRLEIMKRISRNEGAPKEAGEFAFGTIKFTVADAYYRTRMGIHDDLNYQGNMILTEFIGTDVGRP